MLSHWRRNLKLSNRELSQLSGELSSLDRQLKRLINRHIRVAAFGRVGVGKSSLLNALIGKQIFETDVAHGCTRNTKIARWDQPIEKINLRTEV